MAVHKIIKHQAKQIVLYTLILDHLTEVATLDELLSVYARTSLGQMSVGAMSSVP
jgi:hypothetical protein